MWTVFLDYAVVRLSLILDDMAYWTHLFPLLHYWKIDLFFLFIWLLDFFRKYELIHFELLYLFKLLHFFLLLVVIAFHLLDLLQAEHLAHVLERTYMLVVVILHLHLVPVLPNSFFWLLILRKIWLLSDSSIIATSYRRLINLRAETTLLVRLLECSFQWHSKEVPLVGVVSWVKLVVEIWMSNTIIIIDNILSRCGDIRILMIWISVID